MTEKDLQSLIYKLKEKEKKLTDSLDIDDNLHKNLSFMVIDLFGLYHKNRDLNPSEVFLLFIEKNKDKVMDLTKSEFQKVLYTAHCALMLQMNLMVEEYKILNQEYNNLNHKYGSMYRQLELLRSQIYELNKQLKLYENKPISNNEEIH